MYIAHASHDEPRHRLDPFEEAQVECRLNQFSSDQYARKQFKATHLAAAGSRKQSSGCKMDARERGYVAGVAGVEPWRTDGDWSARVRDGYGEGDADPERPCAG